MSNVKNKRTSSGMRRHYIENEFIAFGTLVFILIMKNYYVLFLSAKIP